MTESVQWKRISTDLYRYMVSSNGDVTYLNDMTKRVPYVVKGANMLLYALLDYTPDDRLHYVPVHKLIAEEFTPRGHPRHDKVVHINGNLWDNRAENLRWVRDNEEYQKVKQDRQNYVPPTARTSPLYDI
jgi:hypothetical protein